MGTQGPCGHQQPFCRWCGGERWSWGHIVPGGRQETPVSGVLPLGTCCGPVRGACSVVKPVRELPTPGITGCSSQRPRCFPVHPWSFPWKEIQDEPVLIRGKRPFLWDYSLPLKLGTELSLLEAARHRTSAQRSLSPSLCLGATRVRAWGRHLPARFFSPAQTRHWGVPCYLLSGDILQAHLGRAMLHLHHHQQRPWPQSLIFNTVNTETRTGNGTKQFSL